MVMASFTGIVISKMRVTLSHDRVCPLFLSRLAIRPIKASIQMSIFLCLMGSFLYLDIPVPLSVPRSVDNSNPPFAHHVAILNSHRRIR
jgi:hypothetical protein